MTIILKEGYDQRTIFDERQLVEYVNDKHAVACSLHDDCEHPEKPPMQLNVEYSVDEWLDALGDSYLNFVKPRGVAIGRYPPPTVKDMVRFFAFMKGPLLPHLLRSWLSSK